MFNSQTKRFFYTITSICLICLCFQVRIHLPKQYDAPTFASYNRLGAVLFEPVDSYLSNAILKGTTVWAAGRVINGGVSVLQESTINLGITTLGAGQMLDPINDTIERFCNIIFVGVLFLGILKLCLIVGTLIGCYILIPLLLLLFIGSMWLSKEKQKISFYYFKKIIPVSLLFTIAPLFFAYSNMVVYNILIEPSAQSAEKEIVEVSHAVKMETAKGIYDRFKSMFSDDDFEAEAVNTVYHSILSFCIGFIAQIIVLPFASYWFFIFILRQVLQKREIVLTAPQN